MSAKGNKSILIVDDEATIREVLMRTFSERGYDCVTAACYDEAMERIAEDTFEIAMLDVMMPGKSGVELLESVRKHDEDIAVIMVTAVTDAQTAIGAMRMGAYDYVTKPFNLVEVVMSVERALEKRELVIANRDYQQHLEATVKEKTDELRETYMGAIMSLAEALDAKDPYTNGHSKRVTEISVVIARTMGLGEEEIDRIKLAGTLHDIGKIGVPESVLNKNSKLTDEEFGRIKTHSALGERIIEPFVRDRKIRAIVRHHHERFSGGGYPDGIKRGKIPIGARIMTVADSYDAMTSDRPYRTAMTPDKAKSQLLSNRGSQFDPDVVDAFLKCETEFPFCPLSASPKKAKAS